MSYAYLKVRNLSIKLSNLGVMSLNLIVKLSNLAFKFSDFGIQFLNNFSPLFGVFSRCLKSENSQEKDVSENRGWTNGLVLSSSSRDSLTCQFKPVLLFQQCNTCCSSV